MENKISVLMSVYNDELSVGQAIESILKQSYKNFEFLIIDDSSTDNTYSICNEYLSQDNRIHLEKNTSNIGLTLSLNKLLNKASGRFIARQDSDDTSYENRFSVQEKLLRTTNFAACSTLASIKKQNRTIPNFSRFIDPKITLKFKNPIIHGTLMMKKDVLEKIGRYDENYYFAQDYKLMRDFIEQKYKIKIIKEVLYELNMENNISKIYKKEQKYYANCVRRNLVPHSE
jgi:glycosyltransferase involved in cell wall biosynthesis